jgi:hypothetical protein
MRQTQFYSFKNEIVKRCENVSLGRLGVYNLIMDNESLCEKDTALMQSFCVLVSDLSARSTYIQYYTFI